MKNISYLRQKALVNEFKRYQTLLNLQDWIVDICYYEPDYCASIEILSMQARHAVLRINVEQLRSVKHAKTVARHEAYHLLTAPIFEFVNYERLREEAERISIIMQKFDLVEVK